MNDGDRRDSRHPSGRKSGRPPPSPSAASRRAQRPPPRSDDGPHLPPTHRELPAVRFESINEPPPSGNQRQAWLPPQGPSLPPPISHRITISSAPDFEEHEIDWGSRDTILSRDTVVSDLPPREVERDRALLLRMDGPNAGEVFSLDLPLLLLGRHPSNQIPVKDHGVSRIHARIIREGHRFVIEDAGSSNGTLVQGERVEHRVLEDGDVVQLGPRAVFRFTLADARQEALLRQMYEGSTRDALTGIYNRQHFSERLAAEHAYALRHGLSIAVVLFDIDHFKRVNDTYGHPVGDGVLCHVVATINQRMRAEDVFARYGGEEFIALLRGADIDAARKMAERMRVSVAAKPAHVEHHAIPVTISAGCAALACAADRNPQALVALADERLYVAKRSGRNRVVAGDG